MDFYNSFPPKLSMWYIESQLEAKRWKNGNSINIDYALYPRRFYKKVAELDHHKKYDFCFIGGYKTDKETEINRAWIMKFIDQHFNLNSYLQFTDINTKENYQVLGDFDYTLKRKGFVPKEHAVKKRNMFDAGYFQNMAHSKFTLCPAGDAFWSMRFYEALMCKSIPVVNNVNETFRSSKESQLDYKYYLASDNNIEYREDWAEHNYSLFIKHHTLDHLFK